MLNLQSTSNKYKKIIVVILLLYHIPSISACIFPSQSNHSPPVPAIIDGTYQMDLRHGCKGARDMKWCHGDTPYGVHTHVPPTPADSSKHAPHCKEDKLSRFWQKN